MKLKILKKIFSRHKKRVAITGNSLGLFALVYNVELKSSTFEISRIMRDFFLELAEGCFFALKKQNPC